MTTRIKRWTGINGSYALSRMSSIRLLTCLLMLYFFTDDYLRGFRENVRLLGEGCNLAVLPFLQTSNYCMKLILLGIVYFYSDAPFMEKQELFYFQRLGRKRWGQRNLIYLAVSSFLLTLCLAALSVLEVLPVGTWSGTWDRVYKTLALTGGTGLGFHIPYEIMTAYTPARLMLYTLLLDWMAIWLLGLVMYVMGMLGYRLIGGILCILLIFLPSVSERLNGAFAYYSPLSWIDCDSWRIGYDNAKPDLPYIFVAFGALLIGLMLLAQYLVSRMDWTARDD